MTRPPALPDFLTGYLAARDTQRMADANAVAAGLTPRELALVREAAVMGYVRGTMASKGEKIPKDGAIVFEVIDACLAFADLYPTLTGYVADTTEER